MGDLLPPPAVQFRAAAHGRKRRAALAQRARSAAARRPRDRQAGGAGHVPARCGTGSSLSDARAVVVAVPRGDRHLDHVRVVYLPGAGRRVGIDPRVHHAGGMVLADEGKEAAGARRARDDDAFGERVMTAASRTSTALDVSAIPEYGFGHRSLLWWATAGMMIIEG